MSTRLIKIIPLLSILLVALFLRLFHLNSLPPALFSDEVDAGYQAQTFNNFHTDYFGNFFPVHFHSFSDWRTSAYIYSISLTKLFVNNPDISVRLPSVIFSVLSIYIFYLITKSKISALLLAITPWSIHYGRTGFEVSGMILFFLLGIYFLKTKHYFLSVIAFCLTPYFYSTAKLLLPLFLPIVIIVYHRHILQFGLKKIFLLTILAALILSPMAIDTIRGKSGFRFSYISIFTMPHREQIVDNFRYQDVLQSNPNEIGVKTPFLSYIFHNKYQLIAAKFVQNYFASFSTNFLFLSGDSNPRHGFGQHGLLYLIDFFSIIYGLFIWSKNKSPIGTLFLYLLIISPIPFSLTRDSDSAHATRLIFMLPSLIYFSSLTVSKYKILLLIYLFSFISFWHYYTLHYPQDSARQWHVGMKEAVVETKKYSPPTYFSSKVESFIPFFLYYYPYNQIPKFTEINNDSFSGQSLNNQFYFGQFNPTNLSQIPKGSTIVISKSEYNSGQFSNLKTLLFISKKYLNQEEFYLLTK